MTQVRWGAYDPPILLISTPLNGLASGAISAVGGTLTNSAGALYADAEFIAGAAFSPVAGAAIDLWLLRSVDGGLSFEDGASGVAPSRDPDMTIAIRSGSGIIPRSGGGQLVLPPGTYCAIVRNRTGAVLPSGSAIRAATYTEIAN